MPLQGNLRDFSATQLLNLINLSGRTGTLTIYEGIQTGEKDAMGGEKMKPGKARASVSFKTGKLVFAALDSQSGGLITVLNKAGKLTDEQAKVISQRAKDTGDKALAMLLINANYVSQQDIVNSIKQATLDVVYNIMVWNEGPFRFDDDKTPGKERILVPIDLENVIIEGARRMREDKELNEHIPNLDMSLKFPANPKEKFQGIHLSVEEWRVVSFVNPKNTIRQIAKANNMSDIEIRRIVYGLEQAGLVEIIKPPGMEAKGAAGSRQKRKAKAPQVQKQVVSKLIDKIRSI